MQWNIQKALRKKQQIISLFFGELTVKRGTVGDILSNKEIYDSEEDQGNDIVDFFSALEYIFLHNKFKNNENFKQILFTIKRVHKL
jgi:hypothetical protein